MLEIKRIKLLSILIFLIPLLTINFCLFYWGTLGKYNIFGIGNNTETNTTIYSTIDCPIENKNCLINLKVKTIKRIITNNVPIIPSETIGIYNLKEHWNGTDAYGNNVSAGIYFYLLENHKLIRVFNSDSYQVCLSAGHHYSKLL